MIKAIERFKERTGYYPERVFSLGKRCYGMICITTKLQETQMTVQDSETNTLQFFVSVPIFA